MLNRRGLLLGAGILFMCLVAGGGFYSALNQKDKDESVADKPSEQIDAPNQVPEQEIEQYPFINFQPTVNAWARSTNGSSSIVIYDLNNKRVAASYRPNETYFTASIYKLYVAYIGYQKVADGTYSLRDPYVSGFTRGKCLDKMIRSSYSPCAEKMWVELGKEEITNVLKTYGLKNTSMTGLTTSAADVNLVLRRLFDNKELSNTYANLFFDSLKDQPSKYRTGLPSGFSNAVIYNKVGWNENLEWHDAAIVRFRSGRSYAISVLTRSVGRSNVVTLAEQINKKVNNP